MSWADLAARKLGMSKAAQVTDLGAQLRGAFGPGPRGGVVNVGQAAKALGKSPSTIRNWISGRSHPRDPAVADRVKLLSTVGPGATAQDVAAQYGVTPATARRWLTGAGAPNKANRAKIEEQAARAQQSAAADLDRAAWTHQAQSARADIEQAARVEKKRVNAIRITGWQGPLNAGQDYSRNRTVTVNVDPEQGLARWEREGPDGFRRWLEEQTQPYGESAGADQWLLGDITDFQWTQEDNVWDLED